MKNLCDSKLANQLEELRLNYPMVYLQIKGNVDSVTIRLATQALEEAYAEMRENINVSFDVFIAHPDVEDALSWYLGHGKIDANQIYVLTNPSRSHAGCFLVNGRDKVVARRFILEKQKVTNLLQTFGGRLLIWKKAWMPDNSISETEGVDDTLDFSDMF